VKHSDFVALKHYGLTDLGASLRTVNPFHHRQSDQSLVSFKMKSPPSNRRAFAARMLSRSLPSPSAHLSTPSDDRLPPTGNSGIPDAPKFFKRTLDFLVRGTYIVSPILGRLSFSFAHCTFRFK
jgi:hypothetical protein